MVFPRQLQDRSLRLTLPWHAVLLVLPMVIGVAAIVGWFFDLDFLQRGMVSTVPMSPVTSVSVLLLALALFALHVLKSEAMVLLCRMLSVAVIILGVLILAVFTLAEAGVPITVIVFLQGIPPNTAASLLLLGTSTLLVRRNSERAAMISQILSLTAMLIGFLALVGYLYAVEPFYEFTGDLPMALNSATAVIVISFSALLIDRDLGVMKVFASKGPAGLIAKRLIPAMVLTQLLLGGVVLQGVRKGLYDVGFDHALSAVLQIALFLVLVYLCLLGLFDSERRRAEAEERIRNLAFHDTLTQLPNRRMLIDRLALVMASGKRYGHHGALMFLDLDNFKVLNDQHGHGAGDLLLIEVAARIRQCVRELDTVARFGGDEFVILLGELDADRLASASEASQVAEKIRISLARPYRLSVKGEDGNTMMVEHECSSSIGVVLFQGDSLGHKDVLRLADHAMYRAKGLGRNRVCFHQPDAWAG